MSYGPSPSPYRSTPIFNEHTLPAALRREHRTKQGVWGVIRVLDGELKLTFTQTGKKQMLSPGAPGVVLPDQPHLVEPMGSMQMVVDFYKECPDMRHEADSHQVNGLKWLDESG